MSLACCKGLTQGRVFGVLVGFSIGFTASLSVTRQLNFRIYSMCLSPFAGNRKEYDTQLEGFDTIDPKVPQREDVVARQSNVLHPKKDEIDHTLTTPEVGTASELPCGVFWFLHIPKTGGTTVHNYMVNAVQRQNRWKYVNLQVGGWPCRIYARENISSWTKSPNWQGAARELEKPMPRLLVHDHTCPSGFGARTMPQLLELNRTFLKQGLGCRVVFATVLREPVEREISHIFFDHIPQRDMRMHGVERSDYHIKYILYSGKAKWPEPYFSGALATPESVQQAYNTLRKFELVGRLDWLTEFVRRMCKMLGFTFEALPHLNKGKPHPYELSTEDVQWIRMHQPGDEFLYANVMPNLTMAENPIFK